MGCRNHPEAKIITMCVKWKRRDGELSTRPALVIQGVVEFEEIMTNTCSVYGSRSGPHHSAKYEAKHFLLYASVYGDPELDLGKHRVDLTRLSGKAKGGIMNVSFGYLVVGNSSPRMVKSSAKATGQSHIRRCDSLSVSSRSFGRSVDDVKDLHEVLPISKSELSESVSVFYKKLEERDVEVVPPEPPNLDSNSLDPVYSDNSIRGVSSLNQQFESQQEECVVTESNTKDKDFDDKELLLQELELALNNVVDFEKDEFDSQKDSENVVYSKESGFGYEESENLEQKSYTELKIGYKEKGKSLKLDYATETVADDFLNMLGIEHSPFGLSSESKSNSLRERLLRQFEKDSLANGSLFNFNIDDDDEIGFNSDSPSTSMWDSIPKEVQNKTKASVLEDSNGGFLSSMNPEIFKNAKSGGNLIMQVSSPVVVPAEMGFGSRQASFQQEPVVRQFAADHSDKQTYGHRPQRYDIREPDPEYVSLEDLAPTAMNKIEALSVEGLKIQSDMSDKDKPSNISPQSIGEISALEGKRVNFDGSLGLEGTEGLQLLDVKNSSAVQVERVFVPPKPKIYSSMYSLWNKPVEEEGKIKVEEKLVPVETKEAVVEEEKISVEESVLVPKFKITEVHVAGVKTEPVPSKKTLWGSNTKKQQAGSRWSVANGMGKKSAKHLLMKSKAATSDKSSGSLWSISSKGKGSVNKADLPVRNPNVIIPNETVRLLSGAGFVWPQELLVKYPFLNNYDTPIREDARDSLVWRIIHGNVKKFSVSQVWMIFVIVTLRKLKTQDLVPMWDVSDSLGMSLMPIINRRTTNSVVAKLVVVAATYYVWQEQNWRLFKKFKKGKPSPDQIVECIKSFVRLKLLSYKLRKSKNGERLARLWDLPEAVFK
uniref:C2 NT-type domain-containing protein n=1 Tax=Tanacetum cinerariifolium TaxID=118510 RepID=A0A6L2K8V5_TANCI|nr:hypothetical protein [Tanacetum cinerariifolium]